MPELRKKLKPLNAKAILIKAAPEDKPARPKRAKEKQENMDEDTKTKYLAEVNELIQSRQKNIFSNYPVIREIFKNSYEGDTEVNPLRNEICICIIFGLCQAAITLTNHMIEKYLKIALIYKNANFSSEGKDLIEKLTNATAQSTAAYNSNNMDKNINAACTQGIITKEDKKELNRIRECLRNAYSHADSSKTHSEISIPLTGAKVTEQGLQFEETSITRIASLPMIQGIAQVKHAEANAIPYFQFIDSLIRRTRPNIFKNHKE